MPRVRARPVPRSSGALNIGVSLTPLPSGTGPLPVPETGTGLGEISGPYALAIPSAASCTWLVFMRGVSTADTIEWALVWPEMDGGMAGAAGFRVDPENELPPMVAHIVESYSGFLDIDLYATVNGVEYGPTVLSCAI